MIFFCSSSSKLRLSGLHFADSKVYEIIKLPQYIEYEKPTANKVVVIITHHHAGK